MTNRFFADAQNDRKDKQILHCVQNDSRLLGITVNTAQ